MPFFKVVFQYTQPDHGFTEVYYREASDLRSAANFSSPLLRSLFQVRTALTSLRKARVSDVSNNRSAVVIPLNFSKEEIPFQPDIVSTAAIVTLVSTANPSRRSLWLRGLQDRDVVRNNLTGADMPSAFLSDAIDNLCLNLTRSSFQIRALQRLGIAPMVYTAIASVTVAVPGKVTITTQTPFSATASGRVILSQLDPKLFPGLNGHFAIRNVTSSAFDVQYNSHLANNVYPVMKGRTRPEEYSYGIVNNSLSGFNRFGSRDTGKNPLGGVGRRSSRILRSA